MAQPRGNLFALLLTRVFRIGAGIGVSLLVARLGPEMMGLHGWTLALANVASFLCALGLHTLIVRKVAREPERAPAFLGQALTLLATTAPMMIALMVAWAWVRDGRDVVQLCVMLAGLAMAVQLTNENVQGVFHGLRNMRLELPAVFAGKSLYLLLTMGALSMGFGLPGVFAAQFAGAAITLVVLLWVARQAIGSFQPSTDAAAVRELANETWPFGMNMLYGTIYLSADILMLKEFRADEEVGWYRLAALLGLQLPALAQILNRGLYPRLSKMVEQPTKATNELDFGLRILLTTSMPMAVGGMVLALPIVLLLGGRPDYAPAAAALIILMPMLPLRFVNNGLGTALSALDMQPIRTRAVGFAALFNIGTNAMFIPMYGYLGAAGTTVATDALLTMYLLYYVRQRLPELSVAPSLLRATIPAVVMGAVVVALPEWHVLVRIAVGVAVAVPLAGLTGGLQRGDMERLRGI